MKDLDSEFNKYLEFVTDTTSYPSYPNNLDSGTGSLEELTYCALGLAGETGEAVDCVKKMMRDPTDLEYRRKQISNLFLEMGDVLYYWTRLALVLDLHPSEIMKANIKKLETLKKMDMMHEQGKVIS